MKTLIIVMAIVCRAPGPPLLPWKARSIPMPRLPQRSPRHGVSGSPLAQAEATRITTQFALSDHAFARRGADPLRHGLGAAGFPA